MTEQVFHIIFLAVYIYLVLVGVYFFVGALLGRLSRATRYSVNEKKKKFAVLIPSYREDDIIVDTARSALQHNYPRELFDVYIATDKMQPHTIEKLKALPVYVMEVDFEIGSKARALNHLLNRIPEGKYDIALILDADNLMVNGCMEMINDAFQKGFRAVQVHRTAKNHDTDIATLDAISEEINNHLFRKAQRAMGFSANTVGSGMAFEFNKLKEIYNKPGILSNPACDREVDYEITKSNVIIEYIDQAYVLDEKVAGRRAFEKQRTRWLESQLKHIALFFSPKEAVTHKTKDYWNKLFTNLIPPRLLILVLYLIVFAVFLVQRYLNVSIVHPSHLWWLAIFAINIITILISIPQRLFSLRSARAVIHIPLLAITMVRALFRLKPGRKEFLHTRKTYVKEQRNS